MKAEQFINEYTRSCSNELCSIEDRYGKTVISYHEWLTPDQALRAIEIAREEMIDKAIEWLKYYIHYDDFGGNTEWLVPFENDECMIQHFKTYMEEYLQEKKRADNLQSASKEMGNRIYFNPHTALYNHERQTEDDIEYICKNIVDEMLGVAEDHAYLAGSEAMREKSISKLENLCKEWALHQSTEAKYRLEAYKELLEILKEDIQ